MKVWNMEDSDVMRFVLRRDEWDVLIKALAGAAAWSRDDSAWKGMDVISHAEVDVDASAMVRALSKIADLSKHKDTTNEEIIHTYATNALPPKAEEVKAA